MSPAMGKETPVKALITGGLGFVGTQLSIRLLAKGHQVTIVDHSPKPKPHTPKEAKYVFGDTTTEGPWQEELPKNDVIVNLAGASIFGRWTDDYKKRLRDTRILTTRNVVSAMSDKRETLLCSASAVGYYGFRGDEEITEEAEPGNDFLATLCVDWEREALKATDKAKRVVITRFGIILGPSGGALGQMIPAFKKFVGGPLGSGKQWFSWIHMHDLLSAFQFVFDNNEIEGPVNLCSPNPVRNKTLAQALGEVLSRPSFIPTPALALKLVLGEFGSVLLEGQRVFPGKLQKCGFEFRHPEIKEALRQLVEYMG